MATQKNGADGVLVAEKENEIMEVDMSVKSLDEDDVDAIIEEDETLREGDLIEMDDGEEAMEKYIEEDLDGATMNYDDLVVEDDGESLSNGATVTTTTVDAVTAEVVKEESGAGDKEALPSNGIAAKTVTSAGDAISGVSEVIVESNGYAAVSNKKISATQDDDRPVSIPSDSEGEEEEEQRRRQRQHQQQQQSLPKLQSAPVAKQNGTACDNDEVHEILSDKEDCVMLDDTPPKSGDKAAMATVRKTPLRNVRPEEYDDDIQEIIDDPIAINSTTTIQPVPKKMKLSTSSGLPSGTSLLTSAHNQLAGLPADLSITAGAATKDGKFTFVDPKSLLKPSSLGSDMTSLLAGGGLTISHVTPGSGGMAASNAASMATNLRATITPVGGSGNSMNNNNHINTSSTNSNNSNKMPGLVSSSSSAVTSSQSGSPMTGGMSNILLPALTDDMFVLEAPSFIVPYIYEKPPSENLRQIVDDMKKELDALKVKEERPEPKSEKMETSEEADKNKDSEDADSDKVGEEGSSSKRKDKRGKKGKNADDSWGESDESTDDDASDSETRTKVLIKEVDTKNIESMVLPGAGQKVGVDGKPMMGGDNYFESPLGQFFMSIGMSMVQEHVQADLLRMQKRKQQREGANPNVHLQTAINNLMNNLEASRKDNATFKFPAKRCDFCNYKSESGLAMANHYEKPHLKGNMYKCNFCEFEARPAHDILFHMEAVHNMKSKLEKPLSYHQCPNCTFEDNGKSKLARHSLACVKKFVPENNLLPAQDWDPPAKIPRVKPRHGLVGTATAYQAMAAQQQRIQAATGMLNRINVPNAGGAAGGGGGNMSAMNQANAALTANAALNLLAGTNMAGLMNSNAAMNLSAGGGKSRNRSNQGQGKNAMRNSMASGGGQNAAAARTQQQMANALLLQNNFNQLAAVAAAAAGKNFNNQLLQMASQAMLPNSHSSLTIQQSNPGATNKSSSKNMQQPSISITPLPRQNSAMGGGGGVNNSASGGAASSAGAMAGNARGGMAGGAAQALPKPGQHPSGNKSSFVICEICDGYIKDLDQLRSHMQLIHKVKIHPKMIYNRPPLNCQKCQYRFFTDQGLERHLLGSHGLVTSSMQEAANCGQDSGRCPICGRVYQWKLLNHVSRDHNMTLKPAHLSYKCTVCTATFGMYKQFENHVYSAHSTVAKKSSQDKKNNSSSSSATSSAGYGGSGSSKSSSGDSLLKPLKINDEITIIPQPPAKMSKTQTIEIE